MMRRQRSTPTKRVSTAEEQNSREAFHATHRLYDTLHVRAISKPYYLPRNLRRDFPRPAATHRFPSVKYVSEEPGVRWAKEIPHLRCLWCRGTIPRFWNSTELVFHLRNCHGTLAYTIDTDAERESPVVVSIRLLRGEEGALATAIDRFHTYDLEEVYVNSKKYPNYLRNTNANTLRLDTANRRSARFAEFDRRGTAKPEARAKRTATKKKRKPLGRPVFKTIRDAAEAGRLYQSLLQVPLCVDSYEDGADSDDDAAEENRWRLQLMDTEIEEFIDTIPVEKLFMILWNQFMRMEFVARADRHIGPACMCFVKKYRKTLIRLSLEATFLRHMTELGRRGLVEADVIYETLMVLQDRDMSDGPGEEKTRFLFAERFEEQEARRQRREKEMKALPDANGVE